MRKIKISMANKDVLEVEGIEFMAMGRDISLSLEISGGHKEAVKKICDMIIDNLQVKETKISLEMDKEFYKEKEYLFVKIKDIDFYVANNKIYFFQVNDKEKGMLKSLFLKIKKELF